MRADLREAGFTLIELMVAAAIGVLVCGVGVQLLLGEARHGGQLAQRFLLRSLQLRTLRLIKDDLRGAATWDVHPDPHAFWPCPLAGRLPLLAIRLPDAPEILYSLGSAPSSIWSGPVLMRCGPAFDIQGRPSATGRYQNRVVLDAIEAFSVEQPSDLPVLQLELEQRIEGSDQRVRSSAVG